MRKSPGTRALLLLLALTGCGVLTIAGCGGGNSPESALAAVNESNIQRLANLYFTFQMKNNWKGPKNEEEFKEFLRGYNPKKLERIGIDPNAIDDIFISGRDDQPFRIRYGVPGSAMGSTEPVIFESSGVDGKFLVGFLDMRQEEFDSAESDELFNQKAGSVKKARAAERGDVN